MLYSDINVISLVFSLVILFFSVVLHECSHGWVAYKLGDPTAKYAGRLTLNPIAHIDPIGTVILPLFLFIMRAPFLIGWAKPIPVNFWNLRNPKRDMIWVGLAGPATNFACAIILSAMLKVGVLPGIVYIIIVRGIFINLLLAVFNLIPIPPLDGSRILMGLLPYEYAMQYSKLEKYGFMIVFAFLFLGLFQWVILPIIIILGSLLGVSFV